jgi:hypothetical protein
MSLLRITQLNISRRGLIGGVALISSAGLLAASATAAPIMRSQKVVSYQDTPKGRARCDNCAQWLPPSSCKTVSGVIKPSGWCTAYAPKQ